MRVRLVLALLVFNVLAGCTKNSPKSSIQSSVQITPEEFKDQELANLNSSIGTQYKLSNEELELVASKITSSNSDLLNEALTGKSEVAQ